MSLRPTTMAAGLLLGLPLVVGALDLAVGQDVTLLLRRHDAEARADARRWFAPGDDVAVLHGVPEPHGRMRVLLWKGDADPRIIRPPEDPARRLLVVDRASGGDVTPLRAWWWRSGVAAGVGLLLLAWSARRHWRLWRLRRSA